MNKGKIEITLIGIGNIYETIECGYFYNNNVVVKTEVQKENICKTKELYILDAWCIDEQEKTT